MTWENTWSIVIDQNLSIYNNYYCTSYSDWVCLESVTIYSLNKDSVKQIWVEILSVAIVFWISIWIVAWLIKWIFRLIFPWKWKK